MDLATKWSSLFSEASRPVLTGRGGLTGWADRADSAWAGTDPGAGFHAFVAARSGALFRGALVLTGSREAAEDLVQETLERACRRWRTIAVKDAPDAYVRRIMVNLANDRWRRFRRVVPQPSPGDDRAAPGDEYGRVDSRDQLVRALQRLPMGMRTVVVLRYFHDLSDAEIAEDLRISPSAVRSQLARGLEKLRAQIPALSAPSSPLPRKGTR
ncbi:MULTISPECIES: SigE family RNA polymerase sigma factor [unclassified Streptomyces]|uniref:SigE family RNA polymerase sigma factor n=1 Tax=unclassified Streptomyces TaxID=2593676 RepID=UPI0037F3C92D